MLLNYYLVKNKQVQNTIEKWKIINKVVDSVDEKNITKEQEQKRISIKQNYPKKQNLEIKFTKVNLKPRKIESRKRRF